MNNTPWSLANVWNKSLDTDRQREYEPRDHIWASELGGSYYDRYWKMKGRKPTTPPNLRARRKFEAGNLTEWVVQQILVRAGIYQKSQQHIVNGEGALNVSGRCDFIAGGEIKEVDLSDLPEGLATISEATLEGLRESFPNGLNTQIFELKSCSGQMFERYCRAPATNHALQLFHYAHSLNIPGHLGYLSRDDLRMVEWTIDPDSEKWQKLYDNDINYMAAALSMAEENAIDLKEPLLTWDEEEGKFKKNYKIEYSLYLTDYGYERPDEYAEVASKVCGRINRVVTRMREGKAMTKSNEEAILAVTSFYPPAEGILSNLTETTK